MLNLTVKDILKNIGLNNNHHETDPAPGHVWDGTQVIRIDSNCCTDLEGFDLNGWELKYYGQEGFEDLGYAVGHKDDHCIVIDPSDNGYVYRAFKVRLPEHEEA